MEGMKQLLILLLLSFALCELITACKTRKYHGLSLGPNESGPESLAFDCKGRGPYVGTADGRILKWRGKYVGWKDFAVTSPNRSSLCDGTHDTAMEQACGRPLGLRFNMATCELYIADSSFGIMKVDRHGGVANTVVNKVKGTPFRFLNSLDVDFVNQVIYFSETSARYHHWEGGEAINKGDRSGRLMKYDQKTKTVTVLIDGLSFANGVALSKKKDFVLVAETTALQVQRFWLTGPKAGTSDVFIRLSGGPDNINRNDKGEFWIALQRMANFNAVKVDEYGRVVDCLHSDKTTNPTDVSEFRSRIWIGFVDQPYVNYTSLF